MRWLGFPPNIDSWEPRTTLLADVLELVNDYECQAGEIASVAQPAILEHCLDAVIDHDAQANVIGNAVQLAKEHKSHFEHDLLGLVESRPALRLSLVYVD